MKSKLLQWLAITMIVQIGLIHLLKAQVEYEEAAYMGYLFVGNFFAALIAAYAIYRNQVAGWVLGLGIAAASMAGFSWSRTLGMPGMNVEDWLAPYGIVAMFLEGIFILLFVLHPWKISVPGVAVQFSSKVRYLLLVVGLLFVLSVSTLSYRWDKAVTQSYGYHVGSLKQVITTPATPGSELEQEYGVQVIQAATSMMGSIVDVRIRIIDPDKAHAFLQNQAALLVGDQALILAPHMHSHTASRLKQGKVFIVFFPASQVIRTGSEISLVFGSIRTQSIEVK